MQIAIMVHRHNVMGEITFVKLQWILIRFPHLMGLIYFSNYI
jgi:hypothetical protein